MISRIIQESLELDKNKTLRKERERERERKRGGLLVGQFFLVSAALQVRESKTGRAPRNYRIKYGASSLKRKQ